MQRHVRARERIVYIFITNLRMRERCDTYRALRLSSPPSLRPNHKLTLDRVGGVLNTHQIRQQTCGLEWFRVHVISEAFECLDALKNENIEHGKRVRQSPQHRRKKWEFQPFRIYRVRYMRVYHLARCLCHVVVWCCINYQSQKKRARMCVLLLLYQYDSNQCYTTRCP